MQTELVQWESPQPELGRLRMVVLVICACALLLVLLLLWLSGNARAQQLAMLLTLPWTLVFGVLAWYLRAALRHYRFALLDDGVMLQSGVFWRSEVFVPRVRIQHTDVSQGPLARRLDLATLVLHTAGVKLVNLEIVGLRPERARQLRDELLIRELREPATNPSAPTLSADAAAP